MLRICWDRQHDVLERLRLQIKCRPKPKFPLWCYLSLCHIAISHSVVRSESATNSCVTNGGKREPGREVLTRRTVHEADQSLSEAGGNVWLLDSGSYRNGRTRPPYLTPEMRGVFPKPSEIQPNAWVWEHKHKGGANFNYYLFTHYILLGILLLNWLYFVLIILILKATSSQSFKIHVVG